MKIKFTFLLVIASVLGAFVMFRGCGCAAMPPTPPPQEIANMRATHFAATVAVDARFENELYADRLIDSLRATGLFDRVERLADLPDADLVARVSRHIYGTASIPFPTLLSLGIVPTTVDEEWGEAFTLWRNSRAFSSLPRNAARPGGVDIDFSYTGESTLGFYAGIKSLSASYTSGSPRNTPEFSEAFAVAICASADKINRLLR